MPFIAHACLIIGLFARLRSDINILRRETSERFDAANQESNARFAELHYRLARVEATLETTFGLQGVLPTDRPDRIA